MQIFIHGNKSFMSAGIFILAIALSSVFISWSSKNSTETKRWNKEYKVLQNKIDEENNKTISMFSGDIL